MTAPEKHPQHAGLDELRLRLDAAQSLEKVLAIYRQVCEAAEGGTALAALARREPRASKSRGRGKAPGPAEDGKPASRGASPRWGPEIPRGIEETPSDGHGD